MGSMASRAKQLYELQELDLEIEAWREALRRLESELRENHALIEARSKLAREKTRLAELEREQRTTEWEIEDLAAKIASLEGKLYGGSIRNPKELTKLQDEVEHLKLSLREKEDRALDIMSQVESSQAKVLAASSDLEYIEREWGERQAKLLREQGEVKERLISREQKRRSLVAQIDHKSLELYEELKTKKQGRAIARIERGMCQGCRITLPLSELQRARSGEELVQCSSCERILYMD